MSPSPPCSRVALALICHLYVYLGRLWYALEVSALSSGLDGLEVLPRSAHGFLNATARLSLRPTMV